MLRMDRAKVFLLTLLLALGLGGPALAKVHYIKKGVKFHIGDNKYKLSEDSEFVGSFPLVGKEWIAAFTVSQDDDVVVRIENVWGVDDCPYCDDEVFLNSESLGRFTTDDNHKAFRSEKTFHVKKGQMYYLKIASIGEGDVDDWVFENVIVETAIADVTILEPSPVIKNPEDPMPKFFEPPPGPCDKLQKARVWMPGKPMFDLEAGQEFSTSTAMTQIMAGQSFEVYFKVGSIAQKGDQVSQSLELLTGGDKPSGWVFSFEPGKDHVLHGNLKLHGSYRATNFKLSSYLANQWNLLRVSFCRDRSVHLSVNDSDVSASLPETFGVLPVKVRVLQMKAFFSYKGDVAPNSAPVISDTSKF